MQCARLFENHICLFALLQSKACLAKNKNAAANNGLSSSPTRHTGTVQLFKKREKKKKKKEKERKKKNHVCTTTESKGYATVPPHECARGR